MKSWYIALIALFIVTFLALGRVFNPTPEEAPAPLLKERTASSAPESKTESSRSVDEKPAEELEGVSAGLLQSIKGVEEAQLSQLFKQIELELNKLRDPSHFLIQILQLETSTENSENMNVIKGYTINSFFQRIENSSDFLPSPVVEKSFIHLAKTETHPELALEVVTRLKEFFKYDRDRIIELIDHRSDRDTLMESLF